MTERTTQAIKAFWFPIMLSILGFVCSYSIVCMTSKIDKMADSVNNIDVKLSVLTERYSIITRDIENLSLHVEKNDTQLNQYMIRLYNAEAEIKRIGEIID